MAHRLPEKTADLALHVCPRCRSPLVQPTSWEQGGDRSTWLVGRRCPECEWTGQSRRDIAEIEAFDERLELGTHDLAAALRAMEHEHMREMAAIIAFALETDLIGADDFGR